MSENGESDYQRMANLIMHSKRPVDPVSSKELVVLGGHTLDTAPKEVTVNFNRALSSDEVDAFMAYATEWHADKTNERAKLCHGKAHVSITTCATCGCFIGSVTDLPGAYRCECGNTEFSNGPDGRSCAECGRPAPKAGEQQTMKEITGSSDERCPATSGKRPHRVVGCKLPKGHAPVLGLPDGHEWDDVDIDRRAEQEQDRTLISKTVLRPVERHALQVMLKWTFDNPGLDPTARKLLRELLERSTDEQSPSDETDSPLAAFVRARFDAGDIRLMPCQYDELLRLLGPRPELEGDPEVAAYPYDPNMELSWQTYLGNRGQQPQEVRDAYIAAWYAARAYAAGWPDRRAPEIPHKNRDGKQ